MSDVDVLQRLQAHYDARGVRLYDYKANHVRDLYNVLRKFVAMNGWQTSQVSSWRQIVRELYDDIETLDDSRQKVASVRRWMRELHAIGLVEWTEHRNQRGQSAGIAWCLLDSPASHADVAQLAEATPPCRVRRRSETRQERERRNIRPFCRRSGRRGVGLYELGSPASAAANSLFSARTVDTPLARSPLPTGVGGPGFKSGRRAGEARAIDTVGSHSGAPPAVQGSSDATATARSRSAPQRQGGSSGSATSQAPGEGAVDRAAELSEALAALERRFGQPSKPIGITTWRLWLKAARCAEKFGGWGTPTPGLALRFLLDSIEAWPRPTRLRELETVNGIERPDPKPPASLAYFVAVLDDAARHWRHAYRHEFGLCRQPDRCRYARTAQEHHALLLERRRRRAWLAAGDGPRVLDDGRIVGVVHDVDQGEAERVRAAARESLRTAQGG